MASHPAPLSLGFSSQEYWSGLPFPSPMHACVLSHFSHVWSCATPWTAAHQVPLSTEFSRQEYWSGLPFPSSQGTWVWVNSGSCWRTGGPGVLWFIRLQRVGHDWATELNWTENIVNYTNNMRNMLLKSTPQCLFSLTFWKLPSSWFCWELCGHAFLEVCLRQDNPSTFPRHRGC